jgi:quinoprotein glucose dehydrogenase
LKQQALEIIKEYGFAPVFTPPTEKGVFMTPGSGGGANWPGAAFDPETSILYVASESYVEFFKVDKPDPNRSNLNYVRVENHGVSGPKGRSLIKSPSGIIAIDLKTGTQVWVAPTYGGDGFLQLSALWTHPLATKSLVIAGYKSLLLALDKTTGKRVGVFPLNDANGKAFGAVTGSPMTYMHEGKQYIVAAITDKDLKGSLVALALP